MILSIGSRSRCRTGAMHRNVVFAIGALVIVAGFAFWRFKQTPEPVANDVSSPTLVPERMHSVPSDWVEVGGVKRPPSDVVSSNENDLGFGADRPVPLKPEGFAPLVEASTNSQTKLVSEALKSTENPERYSSFVIPETFDSKAFRQDPMGYSVKYAEVVEPGRVFASSQPGEDVPVIRPLGNRLHQVSQGEVVQLIAQSAPFAPVTFTSQRLGRFSNSLTSITVVADKEGKATVDFTASAGTKDRIDILAASPVTSGQITFVVMVSLTTKSS